METDDKPVEEKSKEEAPSQAKVLDTKQGPASVEKLSTILSGDNPIYLHLPF
jgi:hypothetical protein